MDAVGRDRTGNRSDSLTSQRSWRRTGWQLKWVPWHFGMLNIWLLCSLSWKLLKTPLLWWGLRCEGLQKGRDLDDEDLGISWLWSLWSSSSQQLHWGNTVAVVYSKLSTDELWMEHLGSDMQWSPISQSTLFNNNLQLFTFDSNCLDPGSVDVICSAVRYGTTEICGQDTRWPVWERMFDLQFRIESRIRIQ